MLREIGWVIFDEVHYMRDKGELVGYVALAQLLLRAWCCMGRDHYLAARQCALCVPVCHYSQRPAVCSLDLLPPQTGDATTNQLHLTQLHTALPRSLH